MVTSFWPLDSVRIGGLRRYYNPPWFSETFVPSTPYDPLTLRAAFEKVRYRNHPLTLRSQILRVAYSLSVSGACVWHVLGRSCRLWWRGWWQTCPSVCSCQEAWILPWWQRLHLATLRTPKLPASGATSFTPSVLAFRYVTLPWTCSDELSEQWPASSC